jgi:hypothetical protein
VGWWRLCLVAAMLGKFFIAVCTKAMAMFCSTGNRFFIHVDNTT